MTPQEPDDLPASSPSHRRRRRGWPAAPPPRHLGWAWHAGQDAAWHDTMWSAPRGNPASARIPGGSCRTTPRRSSSGTRRRRAAWARNAPCPPRTPSKSAADAGHGHADHTPGSGHDPLRTSRSRVGWAECRPGTDRCSLPLLPYLRTGTAPGTEPRRSCRELGRSDGLQPVLRPRLASGLLRVPFRLVCPKPTVHTSSISLARKSIRTDDSTRAVRRNRPLI